MMSGWAIALAVATILVGVLIFTGAWRIAFLPFTIRPSRMTVPRLKLHVSDPDSIARVNSILASFVTGFNRTIARPTWSSWSGYCKSLPTLLSPFAHEGGAMGFSLRRLSRFDAALFEKTLVRPHPEFRYLYYVGLGFWWGKIRYQPRRVERLVDELDPLHRYLCFDGYGFSRTFFHVRRNPSCFALLDGFSGYMRHAAYQGAGRALYFLYMDRPDLLIDQFRSLGVYARDAAAGVGLAAAFVNPDRLPKVQELARKVPSEWRADFHLGMCFGLKARSINDVEEFERNMAEMPPAVQEAVGASIRECDRVELLTRDEHAVGGYRRWRERVTAWMAEHIEYPMAAVREVPRHETDSHGIACPITSLRT